MSQRPKLAIISKGEEWSARTIEAIRSLSDDVIVLDTDHEEGVEAAIPGKITLLTEAA